MMTFTCDVCLRSLPLGRLSKITAGRAEVLALRAHNNLEPPGGEWLVWEGLELMPEEDIICQECQNYVALEEVEPEDDLGKIGITCRVNPYYEREFPDKCQRQADLDALKQSY